MPNQLHGSSMTHIWFRMDMLGLTTFASDSVRRMSILTSFMIRSIDGFLTRLIAPSASVAIAGTAQSSRIYRSGNGSSIHLGDQREAPTTIQPSSSGSSFFVANGHLLSPSLLGAEHAHSHGLGRQPSSMTELHHWLKRTPIAGELKQMILM